MGDGPLFTCLKPLCVCFWGCGCLVSLILIIITLASIKTLSPEEQMVVEYLNGNEVYNGPMIKQFSPFRDSHKREALRIGPLYYARIKNTLTGGIRMVPGTRKEFLGAYEVNDGVLPKIVLKMDQYIRLLDLLTGAERIIRGPTALVPGPWEDFSEGVQEAIFIDQDQAPIVLNKADGSKRLHTLSGPFFPQPYEHILELRPLLRVLPHECVVVRNVGGRYITKCGAGDDGSGSGIAFFVGPFDSIVEMKFSSFSEPPEGGLQTIGKETVMRFDLRARKLFFQYDVRTNDNVELRVEGAIFWRISDVEKLVAMTEDPVGDVYYKSRNAIISTISTVDLENFMDNFQTLLKAAFDSQAKEAFYSDRGLQVDSMEITKYDCTDTTVASTLNVLIEEATRRLNRIQALQADIDVSEAKLESDILLETDKTTLIRTQAYNERLLASQEGASEGIQLATSVITFVENLNTTLTNASDVVDMYRLNKRIESQNQRTQAIGNGKAVLLMRPRDLNLELPSAEVLAQRRKAMKLDL